MAKKDNNSDETPIEFYIPKGRSRVPIPINQPHWIYKNSKPNAFDWFFAYFLTILGFTTTVGSIINSSESVPLLIISIFFLVIGLTYLRSLLVQHQKFKSNLGGTIQSKKIKRKKTTKT